MIDKIKAIFDCGQKFLEVGEHKLFPVVSDNGVYSRCVCYLKKDVPGQKGSLDGFMPIDPPITKLNDVTVCAVVMEADDTYESMMQKLADAAKILEAA